MLSEVEFNYENKVPVYEIWITMPKDKLDINFQP